MKSKKERAFYAQLGFYAFCLLVLAFKPDMIKSEVLAFMGTAGFCLASYHVTQGVIDFKAKANEVKNA